MYTCFPYPTIEVSSLALLAQTNVPIPTNKGLPGTEIARGINGVGCLHAQAGSYTQNKDKKDLGTCQKDEMNLENVLPEERDRLEGDSFSCR